MGANSATIWEGSGVPRIVCQTRGTSVWVLFPYAPSEATAATECEISARTAIMDLVQGLDVFLALLR